MNLSWSVLALALIGAEGQQPSQPKPPAPSITVEIDICGPEMLGSPACRQAATAIVGQPCDVAQPDRPRTGILAKVAGLCAERLVVYLLDEPKSAVVARSVEGTACDASDSTCTRTAEPPAPPARIASATLSTQLPKIAKPRTNDNPETSERWPMTLPEAIRIALDNSEVVRVIAFGAQGIPIGGFEPTPFKTETTARSTDAKPAPIVIARLNAEGNFWRFKAEILAEVRSVEQQYWNLAQAHVQHWAADRAVSLAKEVLDREQAEMQIGRGTVASVAEANQRLEQFNLDLVTRTSDVITTERNLRNLLGLPPADNRRIIPVTPAAEENVAFDWDACLNEMMDEQPDIVQQALLVRLAELQLLIARNQLLPSLGLNTLYQLKGLGQPSDGNLVLKALQSVAANPEKAATLNGKTTNDACFLTNQDGYCLQVPLGTGRSPLANSRQAQYILLRSRSSLQQVVHQTTHTLARFFLEVDSNYKQFKTATRIRKAAAQRLDAQRAYYEEGRITIDRFLDSVSQYATAVATEAQYKSTYNIALAALAEAKGTLLADRGIVVAEGPHPRKAYITAVQLQPPGPASGPVKAAGVGQPVKSTPVRWAEVTQVTRRAGKRDLHAITASFDSERFSGTEGPGIISINKTPPTSRSAIMPALATVVSPTTSCCETETALTDVTTKAEAACMTGGGIARTDTACITTRAEPPARSTTWTFSISIGADRPLQINGTITQTKTDDPVSAKP